MSRIFLILGSMLAMTAVAAGAFGAHALRSRTTPELLAVYETGARYQMYHALGLLILAWVASRWPSPLITAAGWLIFAGALIFAGSLYLLTLTGVRWLGAITPIGGVCLIAGWGSLALAAWRGAGRG